MVPRVMDLEAGRVLSILTQETRWMGQRKISYRMVTLYPPIKELPHHLARAAPVVTAWSTMLTRYSQVRVRSGTRNVSPVTSVTVT